LVELKPPKLLYKVRRSGEAQDKVTSVGGEIDSKLELNSEAHEKKEHLEWRTTADIFSASRHPPVS
jgi:hypothetical protein